MMKKIAALFTVVILIIIILFMAFYPKSTVMQTTKNHDEVTIDFEGYIDGKKFEGGSGKDYQLVLGSNSFIPGFEKQLINRKVNSTTNVEVTFPKDYQEKKYANKKALFKTKIKQIKRYK